MLFFLYTRYNNFYFSYINIIRSIFTKKIRYYHIYDRDFVEDYIINELNTNDFSIINSDLMLRYNGYYVSYIKRIQKGEIMMLLSFHPQQFYYEIYLHGLERIRIDTFQLSELKKYQIPKQEYESKFRKYFVRQIVLDLKNNLKSVVNNSLLVFDFCFEKVYYGYNEIKNNSILNIRKDNFFKVQFFIYKDFFDDYNFYFMKYVDIKDYLTPAAMEYNIVPHDVKNLFFVYEYNKQYKSMLIFTNKNKYKKNIHDKLVKIYYYKDNNMIFDAENQIYYYFYIILVVDVVGLKSLNKYQHLLDELYKNYIDYYKNNPLTHMHAQNAFFYFIILPYTKEYNISYNFFAYIRDYFGLFILKTNIVCYVGVKNIFISQNKFVVLNVFRKGYVGNVTMDNYEFDCTNFAKIDDDTSVINLPARYTHFFVEKIKYFYYLFYIYLISENKNNLETYVYDNENNLDYFLSMIEEEYNKNFLSKSGEFEIDLRDKNFYWNINIETVNEYGAIMMAEINQEIEEFIYILGPKNDIIELAKMVEEKKILFIKYKKYRKYKARLLSSQDTNFYIFCVL